LRNLARLIAATDYPPFRLLYSGVYRAAAEAVRLRVSRVRGVLGVYLTGSYLTNQHVHGVSDLDFYVVLARDHDARELAQALEWCTGLFPFLDPFPPVVLDERGEVDDAGLLYRQRAAQLHPLAEQPGFVLGGTLPNAATWVAEVCHQIRVAVEGVRGGSDDLFFWKRRLGALKQVVDVVGGSWRSPPGLGLEAPAAALVGRVQGREQCLAAFGDAVLSLDGNLGLLGVRPPNVPGWGEVFGVPRLAEVTHASLRQDGPWTVRLGGFQVALAHPRWSTSSLFSWRPLLMTGFAEPLLVISRLERADGPLWGWTLEQARRTLAALPEQLEDPRLLDSDWGLVQLFQALVILQALPLWPRWLPDVQAHAEELYPKHKLFLKHLEAYSQALEEGQGSVAALRLPPNFFGYLMAFARAMLGRGEFPRSSLLLKKTTLTVCLTGLEPPALQEVLSSLQAQTRPPDEIVVVDARASGPEGFTGKHCQQKGALGALRDRAAREATSEILAFTHDVPGSDWLAGLERRFLREERLGAVTRPSDPFLPRAEAPRLALRRSAVKELGGYDSTLAEAPDEDVLERLRREGWRVAVSREPARERPADAAWAWRLGQSMPASRRPHALAVYICWPGRRFKLLETRLFPGVVCLHPFLLMHVLLLAGLLTESPWAWGLTLGGAALYLSSDVTCGPGAALRRYLVNLTLTASHLWGGLRKGCLYLTDVT